MLEERLGDGREYLVGGFSLADVAAHTGNFVRLRELAEGGDRASRPSERRSLNGEDQSQREFHSRGLIHRRATNDLPDNRSTSASRTIVAVGWFFGLSGVA